MIFLVSYSSFLFNYLLCVTRISFQKDLKFLNIFLVKKINSSKAESKSLKQLGIFSTPFLDIPTDKLIRDLTLHFTVL